MAAKLTDRSSIPAVIAELTLEEKAHLLTGASSFTTYAVERLGIPSCTVRRNRNQLPAVLGRCVQPRAEA